MFNKISTIERKFLKQAQIKKRRIAIGIVRPEQSIIDSLLLAKPYADLTIVGSKISGFNCIPTKDDDMASKEIVQLVKEKKVDGFARGQIKDSYTHKLFVEEIGGTEKKKACLVLIAKDDKWFMLTSPSAYNALDYKNKKYEVEAAIKFMEEDLKIKPKIAVMSTMRLTGRRGEFELLDEVARRCQRLVNDLRKKRYEVIEYYNEYEKALWEGKCNLLVPSIGILGNAWGKSLFYLGGWHIVCCPYLDQGVVYDDTPRNNKYWFWPVISTAAWINRGTVR